MSATEDHRFVAPIVGPDDPRHFTDSGIEIKGLYDESDVPEQLQLGEPGRSGRRYAHHRPSLFAGPRRLPEHHVAAPCGGEDQL